MQRIIFKFKVIFFFSCVFILQNIPPPAYTPAFHFTQDAELKLFAQCLFTCSRCVASLCHFTGAPACAENTNAGFKL